MACYSRVFSGGVSTIQGGTPSACCNQTQPNQFSTKPTIFDEVPVAVGSIAEAVGYWTEILRQRLAATAYITATSDTIYTITLRRGSRMDVITWQLQNSQGAYPLVVGYTTPADSATGQQFQNVHHALDWLVEKLA